MFGVLVRKQSLCWLQQTHPLGFQNALEATEGFLAKLAWSLAQGALE